MQDIQRCIVIAVQDDPTPRTNMGANAKRFLDHRAAFRTFLAGEMGRNGNHRNTMQQGIKAGVLRGGLIKPSRQKAPSDSPAYTAFQQLLASA